MNEALLVSNVLLWIAVVVLAAVVVALTRQIGVLHERVFPVGALVMPGGPRVGEAASTLAVTDLGGAPLAIGGRDADGRRTLLFFVSPTCPVCKTLLPVVRGLVARPARRASCNSISANSPLISPRCGISASSKRPSLIASCARSGRISASPEVAA